MKKLKMTASKGLTFEEGCNKYLEYCRQRNLREGTIRHYRQSYGYFYKYFDKDMLVEDITQNYINLLVSDVAKQVQEINLLDKFGAKQAIKMRKSS